MSDRRYLTMNHATGLDLEQHLTLELEAAKHEHRRRGPHRNSPLDGTLPLVDLLRAPLVITLIEVDRILNVA